MSLETNCSPISIIVPVYNKEKYLCELLESIISQTFKTFQVLLINDGSSDNSGKICEEYAAKDQRIHVVHTENGGVSKARNIGIEKTTTEWITFVDADDILDVNFLQTLVCNSEDFDIILSGFTRFYEDNKSFASKTKEFSCKTKEDIGDKLYEIEVNQMLNSQCAKLFRKSIIDKYNIRFIEGVSVSEDTLFVFEYFSKVSSILCLNYSGYFYRLFRDTSLSKEIHPYMDYYNAMNELYKYRKYFINHFSCHDISYLQFATNANFYNFMWGIRAMFSYNRKERFAEYQHTFKNSLIITSMQYINLSKQNLWNRTIAYAIKKESILLLEVCRIAYLIRRGIKKFSQVSYSLSTIIILCPLL